MKFIIRHLFVISILVAVCAVAVVGLIPAVANDRVLSHTRTLVSPMATMISGSDPNAIFSAVNTNPSGGGVQGQVGPSLLASAAGAGVYGIFNASTGTGEGVLGFATNGSGIIAESFGGNAATMYSQNFSPFAGPAVQGVSNGNGVVGTSAATNGIVGITNSSSNTSSGMLGEDLTDVNGFNSGVIGTTISGSFGVQGVGQSGGAGNSIGGVLGIATTGIGVEGSSSTGIGVLAQATSGTGNAITASSLGGYGLNAFSTNYRGALIENNNSGFYTLKVQMDNVGGIPFGIFKGATNLVNVDNAGNMVIIGHITTAGGTLTPVRLPQGDSVGTYSSQQAQPTLEDVGEAQLTGGYAAVALDRQFSAAIDHQSNYLVFITPQGDSNGLYVSQKNGQGFVVREHGSARSTLAFDYRIVAKPYGVNSPRLPVVGDSHGLFMHQESGRAPLRRSSAALSPAKARIIANPSLLQVHQNSISKAPPAAEETRVRKLIRQSLSGAGH